MSTLHGFEELRVRRVKELHAQLHEYTHTASGARLCWLEREDENKTFCASFRTLPFDDSGVFHILEHSVLCGSRKFPVKEPFVELLKGSLNTFLNAFTYPDKTCYPVSSRNDQDFLNLMRVYLDAVFFPSIYQKPEIFQQEGWHYELHDDVLTRSGVVLNEMKGAFAEEDTLLSNALSRALFPDSAYRFESGGDPEAIPTLSYETFTATHRRFYHPSNSYLLLDGSIDLQRTLALLDEYLSQFTAIDPDTTILPQPPVHPAARTIDYPLPAGEAAERRWKLGRGYVFGTFADTQQLFAMQILCDVLCGSNHAPLCRAVLDRGLAENVLLSCMDEYLQPFVVLQVQNFREDDLATIENTLHETLCALCESGLDHAQLEASLASLEFKLRERDYGTMPRGLVYILEILSSWLYDGDPAARLSFGPVFDQLRSGIDEGYYEALLRRLLLENPHTAQILMRPSLRCGQQRQEKEAAALRAALDAMRPAEKATITAQQALLAQLQQQPDSQQALATIPHVALSDLPRDPASIPTQTLSDGTLLHPLQTDGILYPTLYFTADDLSAEELPYAALLDALISQLAADGMDAQELQRQQRLLLGSFSIRCMPVSLYHKPQGYRLYLAVSCSALASRLPQAIRLVAGMLTRTDFSDREKLLALLRQLREGMQQQIISAGSSYALMRAGAALDAASACAEQCGGITFYRWLCALEKDFDARADALRARLQALSTRLFAMDRLRLSLTGGSQQDAQTILRLLQAALPVGQGCGAPQPVALLPIQREGIVIPSEVSFAGVCGMTHEYSGALRIAARAASLGHYWNEIRVQGGAYGTGLSVRDSGLVSAYTYRDPDCARSRRAIAATGSYLRQLSASGAPQDINIIGAISDAEPLLSERLKGAVADTWLLKGMTLAERSLLRHEMLDTTAESLADSGILIEQALATGAVCVLGPRTQLEACGDLTLSEL